MFSKIFYTITFTLFSLLFSNFAFAQDKKLPLLQAPDLKVSIPNMQTLENIQCTGETCYIPWLGQYIAGIQGYAIGIVGIIAVIVLMIGGIIWLTATGNQSQIEQSKKMIGGSLVGLFLVFGSYLILYLVNPNLTTMKSLPTHYIQNIPLTFSLSEEEFKESDTSSVPYGTRLPIETELLYNRPIKNIFTNLTFFNPYNYIKIKSVYAQRQSFPPPPTDIPLIEQTNPLVANHDYSTEDGYPCICDEDYGSENTNNTTCTDNGLKSTIKTSGCGIAALNMVMAAWNVIGNTPQDLFEMASRMGDHIEWRKCKSGTKKEGLVAYAQRYGMTVEIIGPEDAEELIKMNYPIMLSVGPGSGCTTFGHWIVVHEKLGDGTYVVKNPYRKKDHNAYCQQRIDDITTDVKTYLFIHP